MPESDQTGGAAARLIVVEGDITAEAGVNLNQVFADGGLTPCTLAA